MGDDEAPTAYAPTELAQLTEPSEAWSLVDEVPERRSWRPVILAVAGSLAVVVAATVLVVDHLRAPMLGDVAMVAPDYSPSTVKLPPVGESGFEIPPPPPTTVTVVAPPPAPRDGPSVEDYNAIFVDKLRANGVPVFDESSTAFDAQGACSSLRNGATPYAVMSQFVAGGATQAEASIFVNSAMATYPGCG